MGYAVHLCSTILPVAAPALCINAHMQDVFMWLEQVSLPNEADLLYCLVRFTHGIERAVRISISTLIHLWNSASNVQVGDPLYMIIELRFFHFMCVCVYLCADHTSQCVFAGQLEYYPQCDSENSQSNLKRTCLQRYSA